MSWLVVNSFARITVMANLKKEIDNILRSKKT